MVEARNWNNMQPDRHDAKEVLMKAVFLLAAMAGMLWGVVAPAWGDDCPDGMRHKCTHNSDGTIYCECVPQQ